MAVELVPRFSELVGVAANDPSVLDGPNAVSFVGVGEETPGLTLDHTPA